MKSCVCVFPCRWWKSSERSELCSPLSVICYRLRGQTPESLKARLRSQMSEVRGQRSEKDIVIMLLVRIGFYRAGPGSIAS
jgi:hypothetical protein